MEKLVQGYVIKVSPYQENDCIITLLLKDSGDFLSFKARGILKSTSKNAPSCQLYTLGEYLLDYKNDNGNNVLKTGVILDRITAIYEKMEINLVLGLVCEGIIKIDDGMDSQERLDLYGGIYDLLKTKTNYGTMILVILKYFMLYCGVLLEADGCVECGRKNHLVDVSYQAGGYLCYDCNHHLDPKRSELYLKNYRYVIKAELKNINDFEVPATVATTLINEFFEYLENSAGLRLKSPAVIGKIF